MNDKHEFHQMEELDGLVYRSTGSWYVVKDQHDQLWNARIKGKFKIDNEISSTNPIAIGDRVRFAAEDEAAGVGIIHAINKRKNYIVRTSPHNKHQRHIVAANLDLAVVVATIASPRTSTGFIDRFLITAEAYHVPAIIIVNKIDLLKAKHEAQLQRWQEIYGGPGYEVIAVSALDSDSLLSLQQILKGKTTLFSGHSGAGKSTLINQLLPDLELKTAKVSDWSGKGMHTTTFAEMFDLPDGGKIIDTPGVKEFGLVDVERTELSHYFPEMRKLMTECRFNNCLHLNEPDCAVIQAFESGEISEERYVNYLTIMDTIEEKWK